MRSFPFCFLGLAGTLSFVLFLGCDDSKLAGRGVAAQGSGGGGDSTGGGAGAGGSAFNPSEGGAAGGVVNPSNGGAAGGSQTTARGGANGGRGGSVSGGNAGGRDAAAPKPDTATPSAGGTATPLEFCETYLQTVSRAQARCFGSNAANTFSQFLRRVIDCQDLVASVAEGRMIYDRSYASACLSEIDGVDCLLDGSGTLVACERTLRGTVQPGEACAAGVFSGCVSDASCELDSSQCSGVCKARVALGGTCRTSAGGSDRLCVDGASCVSGVCLAEAKEGQPCGGSAGPDCVSSQRCVGATSTTSGVCRPVLGSGSCTNLGDCGGGFSNCAGPTGAKTCVPFKFSGEACTPGQGECWYSLYCNSEGRCADVFAGENQACGLETSGERVLCDSGLYCKGIVGTAMGRCVPFKAVGEVCVLGDVCGGKQGHCDTTAKVCVACP